MTELSFILINDNQEPLVDLAEYPILKEPVYFQLGFSSNAMMRCRRSVAEKLLIVQKLLPDKMQLKVWDAFRPRNVQQAVYNSYFQNLKVKHPDYSDGQIHILVQRFVSPPSRPSTPPPHSTGGAIDLTLCDKDGIELNMGTHFDHIGPESGFAFFEEPGRDTAIRDRRRLLRQLMEQVGFAAYQHEWWDYSYGTQYWASVKGEKSAFFGEVLDV